MATKADKTYLLDTARPASRKQLYRVIRGLAAGTYSVDLVKHRWRVGDGQRRFYWGYLVVEVSKLIKKDREATDKVLNALFLSEEVVIAMQPLKVVRSLSDLDPAAAATYFEDIANWVWATFRVRLKAPDPLERKASKELIAGE